MKYAALMALLVMFMLPLRAQAQETQPGDACSTAGMVRGTGGPGQVPGIILVCNGTTWKAVETFTTDGKSLFQVNSDSGSCTTDKQGRLRYTSASDLWEYCTGSTWSPFEHAGASSCNIFGQVPGYVCPDGTVFAGFAPDLYVPLFTTRCDAGQTYSGSCTGTRVTLPWNNGNTTGYVTTSLGLTDGQTNTTALSTGGANQDSDSGVGGVQPHQAAQYCSDLVIHGHDDWYLPSLSEIYTMHIHQTAIGNFFAGAYWSSSEYNNSNGFMQSMNFGTAAQGGKNTTTQYIRCARRNS